MKPHVRRTCVNLFGPIGDLAEVGPLFDSLFPSLPDWARDRPVWRLETNSLDLRDDELPEEKPSGTCPSSAISHRTASRCATTVRAATSARATASGP